jgi:hypothetical protein
VGAGSFLVFGEGGLSSRQATALNWRRSAWQNVERGGGDAAGTKVESGGRGRSSTAGREDGHQAVCLIDHLALTNAQTDERRQQ